MRGSTGMAPLACQKSPRNAMPASLATASRWTASRTSTQTREVRRLRWRSEKTTHRRTRA